MSDFICGLYSAAGGDGAGCRKFLWGKKVDTPVGVGCAIKEDLGDIEQEGEDSMHHVESSQMFCNLSDGAEVVFPVYPLCITGPEEYKYSDIDELNPVDVFVNGEEVYGYIGGCSYNTFWVDVPLSEGTNTIQATINFLGSPLSSEIELQHNPNFPTAAKNLLYGIHGRYVTVVDLDEGRLLGKIGTDLEGLGPKNVVLSPDNKRLYIPREIGLEVFDTSNHHLTKVITGIETGGRAAIVPGGSQIFVNRYTIDNFDTEYRINVFDPESGSKLFDFFGGGPDYKMLVPEDKQRNLYIGEGDITVYYSAALYESTKNIPVYVDNFEADPAGENIIAAGSDISLIDTKTDEIVYYFDNLNGASGIAFSPDGGVVYLGGYNTVIAHRFSDQATLWESDLGWEWDTGASALAIDEKGERLYGLDPDQCGANIAVIDTKAGELVRIIPAVPIEGHEIVFKPAQ